MMRSVKQKVYTLTEEEAVELFLEENDLTGLTRSDVKNLFLSWKYGLYGRNLETDIVAHMINRLVVSTEEYKMVKDITGKTVSENSHYSDFMNSDISAIYVYVPM